jgi:hypothetical protein
MRRLNSLNRTCELLSDDWSTRRVGYYSIESERDDPASFIGIGAAFTGRGK